jgi:beta-N-acetylhexosaminidase
MWHGPSRAGAVCALALTALTSCGHNAAPQGRTAGSPIPSATSAKPPAQTPRPTPRPAATAAPGLTRQQLAGQRVIYSYKGTRPPAALLDLIRRGEAAGVIFFKPNVPTTARLRATVAELTKANAKSPVKAPLLLMTDQEGGQIRRLPGAPVPSAKQTGRSKNPQAATDTGRAAAANLKGLGLNLNLAPVLDVYRHPGDFTDQFGRSYSSDPVVAGRMGTAFLRAQQQGGVAATAKHFPGLGAAGAKQNTDEVPVTLHQSAATLRAVDERPYQSAVGAGVKLVMLSWAVYPALDGAHPAGLSRTIIQGELRKRLGFRGVTITDALEAGALKHMGSIAHRGVLAADAGMDLLLFSAQDVSEGVRGRDALSAALASGRLNQAAFQTAAQRVLALRRSR